MFVPSRRTRSSASARVSCFSLADARATGFFLIPVPIIPPAFPRMALLDHYPTLGNTGDDSERRKYLPQGAARLFHPVVGPLRRPPPVVGSIPLVLLLLSGDRHR